MAETLHPPYELPLGAAPTPVTRQPAWDLLLVCVAVYIAMAVGRVHQLFPTLLVLKPALVAAVLSIGLYLLQQSGARHLGWLHSRATVYLLALLLWSALSVPGALTQGVALAAWTDFAKTVVMSLVIAGSVRRVRDVERLTLVYFGVAVVYGAVVLSRFQLGADNWRLGRLYNYDANDFATFIATAMPLGLYFVLGRRRLFVRALAITGLAVLAVGLIRSGSRGGLLAVLAVTAFVVVGFTSVPKRSRLVGLVLILAVAVATASDQYWNQMQTLIRPRQDYNLTSDAGRVRIWQRGLGYMAAHPVLGVGISNFHVAEGRLSPLARLQERGIGVRWGAAHNSFIQAGAEIGIPGLLLFIGLIATTFRSLRRVARQTSVGPSRTATDPSRLAQSLMAALVGFVVGSFFLSLAYMDMLYTLAALALGLHKVVRAEQAHIEQRPRHARM